MFRESDKFGHILSYNQGVNYGRAGQCRARSFQLTFPTYKIEEMLRWFNGSHSLPLPLSNEGEQEGAISCVQLPTDASCYSPKFAIKENRDRMRPGLMLMVLDTSGSDTHPRINVPCTHVYYTVSEQGSSAAAVPRLGAKLPRGKLYPYSPAEEERKWSKQALFH